MNEQVKAMIAGFKLPYETYKGMLSEEEMAEFTKVYEEMLALAEEHDDFMAFNDAITKADIFNRLTVEMGKVQAIADAKPKEERKPPSAESFLNQYRALYEQAQAQPHAYKTVQVYEKLLAMGESAETPLEIVAKAEGENLFHKIGSLGVYDTYKVDYDKTDPNETVHRDFRADVLKICEESETTDELTYRVDLRSLQFNQETVRDDFMVQLISKLVGSILSLEMSKAHVRAGRKQYISAVIVARKEGRNIYGILTDEFSLDWEKIVSTMRYKKRLIMQKAILPETSRVWASMPLENLDWMKETLYDEILSDLSTGEIILRRPKAVFHLLTLDEHEQKFGLAAKLEEGAREHIKDFYWAK